MAQGRIAFALLIGALLPSSAWAVSQGASCRTGARAQQHLAASTLLCWSSQDPWQDCGEDPWQLSTWGSSRDTFTDPWQDSADPWQPFVTESIARRSAQPRSALAHDPWRTMQVRVVRIPGLAVARDTVEDPWQPAFAVPRHDDVDDPWQ